MAADPAGDGRPFLAALVTTMAQDGSVDAGGAAPHVRGLAEVVQALAPFTPGRPWPWPLGVAPELTRQVARGLVAAGGARGGSVYGRIGSTTTEFGTLNSWLIDVVNTASGNLDRPGGAMLPTPVAGGASTRASRERVVASSSGVGRPWCGTCRR